MHALKQSHTSASPRAILTVLELEQSKTVPRVISTS